MRSKVQGATATGHPGRVPLFAVGVFVVSLLMTLAIVASNALAAPRAYRPTSVLVQGAFAGTSDWNAVAARLVVDGYPVGALANPLRDARSDARYVSAALPSIPGPVVLVGHSHGGSVISSAAAPRTNVTALAYVAGFAPDEGESLMALSARFPGNTLARTLTTPVVLPDGGKDQNIDQAKYPIQFAADVPASEAVVMAATQHPIAAAAFDETAGAPAWKKIPSWFLYGSLDKNIPASLDAFMAKQANARKTVEVEGASHVVMISPSARSLR